MIMIFDKLPKPFLVLAPMDDVTDTAFRQIVSGCAKPDLFMTEFVNVDGLQSAGRSKLLHKLRFSSIEMPIIAQVWGLKPENFYKTTKELKVMGFSGVDLNMGCPIKKIVKNGACAGLMSNRGLASEIIAATREAAGKDFPVSVKTRVGLTTFDKGWIEFILTHKLDLLSIHARTVQQMSKTPADWSVLEDVRQIRDAISPSTKLVGNGGLSSRTQAESMAAKYKLDGIMIGQDVLHDPFVFGEESPWKDWSKKRKLELFKKHIKLHIKSYKSGERKFETLRKFCKVYINDFEGASELRAKFMTTHTPEQALTLLQEAVSP